MVFRCIPACDAAVLGSEQLDDEMPVHTVNFQQDFWLGETPVTQEQFSFWNEHSGGSHENHFGGLPAHPAENLDWYQGKEFCNWLNEYADSELAECRAHLPSESQWEYACRATSIPSLFTSEEDLNRELKAMDAVGWHGEAWASGGTHAVGAKAANNFGLYDMHGNVWEWCEDVWDPKAYSKRDSKWTGKAWELKDAGSDVRFSEENEAFRVLRGGSWCNHELFCRCATRCKANPLERFRNFGFRVCLSSSAFTKSISQ